MEIHTATRTSFWRIVWEAGTKTQLCKILGEVKLTYQEMSTVLSQIEACLNSRPLVPLNNEDDGIEALTPAWTLSHRPTTQSSPRRITIFVTQKMALLK